MLEVHFQYRRWERLIAQSARIHELELLLPNSFNTYRLIYGSKYVLAALFEVDPQRASRPTSEAKREAQVFDQFVISMLSMNLSCADPINAHGLM